MKLVETNWQPSNRQLRQFAVALGVALPAITWYWGGTLNAVSILTVIGLLIAVAGMVWPSTVKHLFIALSLLATPIGMVLGEVAMLLIYFCCFLPIGLAFRVIHRDSLKLKLQRGSQSYWESKVQPRSLTNYYRQF